MKLSERLKEKHQATCNPNNWVCTPNDIAELEALENEADSFVQMGEECGKWKRACEIAALSVALAEHQKPKSQQVCDPKILINPNHWYQQAQREFELAALTQNIKNET